MLLLHRPGMLPGPQVGGSKAHLTTARWVAGGFRAPSPAAEIRRPRSLFLQVVEPPSRAFVPQRAGRGSKEGDSDKADFPTTLLTCARESLFLLARAFNAVF